MSRRVNHEGLLSTALSRLPRGAPPCSNSNVSRAARHRPQPPPTRPPRRGPRCLVLGQRAIGTAESQRESERLTPLAHLLALEPSNRRMSSSSSPPPLRSAASTAAAGTEASTTTATSCRTAGNGEIRGAEALRSRAARRDRSPPHTCGPATRRARAPRDAAHRRGRRRCRRTRPPRSAPMPRQVLRGAQFHGDTAGVGDGPDEREASAASTARPGPHGPDGSRIPANTTATCSGCAGSDPISSAICSSVGRRSTGSASTGLVSGPGWTTCATPYNATSR